MFIVSLPQYVVLEEDHLGKFGLMEVLNMLITSPSMKKTSTRLWISAR